MQTVVDPTSLLANQHACFSHQEPITTQPFITPPNTQLRAHFYTSRYPLVATGLDKSRFFLVHELYFHSVSTLTQGLQGCLLGLWLFGLKPCRGNKKLYTEKALSFQTFKNAQKVQNIIVFVARTYHNKGNVRGPESGIRVKQPTNFTALFYFSSTKSRKIN